MNLKYLLKHPELFQYVIGINYSQFLKLLPKFSLALRKTENIKAYSKKRIREVGGGRKAKLLDDYQKLFFILFYYKTYPTFRFAQILYSLDKRNIQLWVKFLSPVLSTTLGYELSLKMRQKISGFNLWLEEYPELREFIVDCTERAVQRPQDNKIQEKYYSGKKKHHTVLLKISYWFHLILKESWLYQLAQPALSMIRDCLRMIHCFYIYRKIPLVWVIWATWVQKS